MKHAPQAAWTAGFLILAAAWLAQNTGKDALVACAALAAAVACRMALWKRSETAGLVVAVALTGLAVASVVRLSVAEIVSGHRRPCAIALAVCAAVQVAGWIAETRTRGRPDPLRGGAAVAIALPVWAVLIFTIVYVAQKTLTSFGASLVAESALERAWNLSRTNVVRGTWIPIGLAAAATIRLDRTR